MSISEDLQNQTEHYLDNKLSVDAKKAFEMLIQKDQELATYVSVNKEMREQFNDTDWSFNHDKSKLDALENYLKSKEAKTFQATIEKVNKDFKKQNTSNKKSYYTYFAIAASIVVLVGFFMFNNQPSNLEIYTDYRDWSNLPSLTTRGDSDNALLVDGEKAFLEKDFTAANNAFKAFLNTSKEDHVNALLYYGVSNIELGNYDEALESFNQLIASEALDKSKGYWYKVLTYLKMDDKASAIKELKILVNDASNFNFSQAKELLEKLDD